MADMNGHTIIGQNFKHKETGKYYKTTGWVRVKVDGYGWCEYLMYYENHGNPLALYAKTYVEFCESFDMKE